MTTDTEYEVHITKRPDVERCAMCLQLVHRVTPVLGLCAVCNHQLTPADRRELARSMFA